MYLHERTERIQINFLEVELVECLRFFCWLMATAAAAVALTQPQCTYQQSTTSKTVTISIRTKERKKKKEIYNSYVMINSHVLTLHLASLCSSISTCALIAGSVVLPHIFLTDFSLSWLETAGHMAALFRISHQQTIET